MLIINKKNMTTNIPDWYQGSALCGTRLLLQQSGC
jgi:hypothetical protein